MLLLSAMVHTRKKAIDQDVEGFLFRHPYIGMLLGCVVLPVLSVAALSAVCCAIMLPISFFMGWL